MSRTIIRRKKLTNKTVLESSLKEECPFHSELEQLSKKRKEKHVYMFGFEQ